MSFIDGLKKLAGWILNPANTISDILFDVLGKQVGISQEQREEMRQRRYETAKQHEANKALLGKAKIDFKIKKLEYKAEQYRVTDKGDLDYDQMIIRANMNSWFDEFVASVFLGLILFTIFTPVYYQVQSGEQIDLQASWTALAEAPWWFGFSVVGIIVSRLGLMRFFRLWTERFMPKRKIKTDKNKSIAAVSRPAENEESK